MNPDTQIGSSGGAFPISQPENKGYTINKEGYLEIAGKRCVVKKNNKEIIGTSLENKRILEAVGQIFSKLDTSMESGDVWRIKQDKPEEAEIELRRGQESSIIRKLDQTEIDHLKPTSILEQFKTWASSVKKTFTNFFSSKKPIETESHHRKSVSYDSSDDLKFDDTQSQDSIEPLNKVKVQALQNRLRRLEIERDVGYDAETVNEQELEELRRELAHLNGNPTQEALQTFEKKLDDLDMTKSGDAESTESLARKKVLETGLLHVLGDDSSEDNTTELGLELDQMALKDLEEAFAAFADDDLSAISEKAIEPAVNRQPPNQAPKDDFDKAKDLLELIDVNEKMISAQKRNLEQRVIKKFPILSHFPQMTNRISEKKLEKAIRGDATLKACEQKIETAKQQVRRILTDMPQILTNERLQQLPRNLGVPLRKEVAALLKTAETDELKRIQSALNEMLPKYRNEHLLDVIMGRADAIGIYTAADMREALIVSGCSTVDVASLFRCIFEKLAATTNENEKDVLMNFCVEWCRRNEGTIKFEKHLDKLNDEQKAQLNQALAASPPSVNEAMQLQPGKVEFTAKLNAVMDAQLNQKEYREFANMVAKDLKNIQGSLYLQLTPDALLKTKWAGDKSPQDMAWTNNFNKFSYYIINCLLKEDSNAEQRANLIKFFIDVARAAYKDGDFYTAMCIKAALTSTPVFGMKSAWEIVNGDSQYKAKWEKLANIFSSDKNYQAYKQRVNDMGGPENVVQYQGISATEIMMISEAKSNDDDNATYNFKGKLLSSLKSIRNVVAGQPKIKEEMKRADSLHSDLSKNLKEFTYESANAQDILFDKKLKALRDKGLEKRREA